MRSGSKTGAQPFAARRSEPDQQLLVVCHPRHRRGEAGGVLGLDQQPLLASATTSGIAPTLVAMTGSRSHGLQQDEPEALPARRVHELSASSISRCASSRWPSSRTRRRPAALDARLQPPAASPHRRCPPAGRRRRRSRCATASIRTSRPFWRSRRPTASSFRTLSPRGQRRRAAAPAAGRSAQRPVAPPTTAR